MTNCNYRAANGQPSLLYASLAAKFGPIRAEQYWYETKTRQFIDKFSDIPLDNNGEPTMEWATKVFSHSALELPDSKPEQPTVELTPDMFTKDGTSESNLSTRIKALYDTATKNPDKVYQVPFKRNTPGIKNPGGPRLTMTRLSELFLQYPIPENVKFDPTFEGLMSVTPTRILNDIPVEIPSLIPVNAQIIEQSKENNFLKMRDEFGQPTGGWFSYEKQQEAIDSVIYIIYSRYMKGVTNVQDMKNAVEQVLKSSLQRHLDILRGKKFKGFEDVSKEIAEQRIASLQELLNVFFVKGDSNNLWNFAINRLKIYGLNIYQTSNTDNSYSGEPVDIATSQDGEYLRSYRDSSFELDRKDTASSRIKLFLSAIEDSDDRRIIRMAFTSALIREQVLTGEKTVTIRTPEVAADLGLQKGETAVTKIDGRLVKVMSLGPITESQLEVFADVAMQEGIDLKPGMIAYSLSPIKDESTLAIHKNYLGMPKLINFENTFQKLMALLANQEPSLSNYMTLLWQSPDPVIRRVAEKLDRETEQVKNEFVSVMSNQYQQFTVVMYSKETGKDGIVRIQSRSFSANYSSQLNVLLRNWEQAQKLAPIAIKDASGNISIDQKLAQSFAQKLAVINDSGSHETAGVELFREILSSNGIELPQAFYESFVKNALALTKGTRLQGNFVRQFGFNKDGTPAGIISALVSRFNGINEDENEQPENSFQVNNPMYTEGTVMNILARAAIQYLPQVYSNTHKSSEGKSIYDHGLNTSLSHKVRRLKTDEDYRKKYGSTYINEHNLLLAWLNKDPEARDRFQVTYLDGIKPDYKSASGTSRSDMSFREQLLYSLSLFEKRGSKKYADYLSLTHSDKTTSPVFLNGPKIRVTGQRSVQGPEGPMTVQVITNETYQAFYSLFLDEYNRITKTTESYNAEQFDKGKKYFYTMPEFNLDRMKKLLEKGEITKEEFNGLWTDLGAIKPIETPEAKKVLMKLFNRRIDILQKRTQQSWINEELFTDNQVPFSMKYMNQLLYAVGITAKDDGTGKYTYTNAEGLSVSNTEVVRIAGFLASREYAVNTFLFNGFASRLLYGDPALFFKKDVVGTMIDYAKRLAKDIAPGKDGEWSHSPKYTTIMVEDWEGPASEVQQLVTAYSEGVNATDGQELITVKEYLDGKLAVGQITRQVYDEMVKIIQDANGGYYEFTKPEHKITMQPQKPVYVGEGELNNGVILTHYIKPSAYPLLPAYTVGKQLDALRTAMERGDVARIYFKSAGKVGRPGVKLKLFNEDGSMDMSALESPAFTGIQDGKPVSSARQILDRKGFRIQQEIPHDPDKRKIGIVTQMNKLIVQGITQITTPFNYQGNQVSAQALVDAKTEIRKTLFDLNKEKVLSELGVVDGELTDFDKLYDVLMEEAATRPGYTINDMELLMYRDNEGKPLMPMIFSPSRARFESLLMNKIGSMTDMKVYGRSFIQATSAGLQKLSTDLSEVDKKRVVFVGDYRGGDLKTLRHDTDGTVRPAQVLVPFRFFTQNGKTLDIKSFMKTDENGYQVIDHGKLPAEFLQMVGARIPNQGHSSMLPIEIVGFLPDEMGDTMIVPAAITKQMGSDFDIDKLYTYFRPYEYTDGKFTRVSDYEDKLIESYFDIHWSILMHPEMTKRILSPLDKPDLKLEAEKVETPADADFFDVVEQLQAFQSQKFAKQLVGFTALTLTSNAVFEQLNVKLTQSYIDDDGNPQTKPFAIPMVDSNNVVHDLGQFSGQAESINHDIEGSPTRSKNDNIVILLSGFLDHAKEPITPQINLNLYTYNAAAALLRLQTSNGVAAGIPELAALLRQPILLEFSKMMAQANDSLSETFEQNLYDKVVETLMFKYMDLGKTRNIRTAAIDLKLLRAHLKPQDSTDFYQHQIDVLQLFDILWKAGKQLADVQSAFSWDVGGAGPSILVALNKENAIEDAKATTPLPMSLEIEGLDQMYSTEQGYIRNNIFEAINMVALQAFPYDKLTPVLDQFKKITGSTFISPKVQQLLIEGYLAYQWTDAPIWGKDENTIGDRARLMYSGSHGASLARRVQDAKVSWGRDNYLLQLVEANISAMGAGPDFVTYSLGISNGFDAVEVARSWNSLLASDEEQKRRLGEDLIRYAILTGNTSTLARHVPISYILGTSLIQATDKLQTGDAIAEIFIQQFLQHYPQYAKTLSSDLQETGLTYEEYPESFKVLPVEVENLVHPGRKLWVRNGYEYDYPEFLSYRDTTTNKWILYQKTAYLEYERIDTLGNNQIDEYSPAVGESILPENRAYRTTEIKEQVVERLPQKGDWDTIRTELQNIANSPKEPTLYRELATFLQQESPIEQAINTNAFGPMEPFSFEFIDLAEGKDGEYNSVHNLLQIRKGVNPSRLTEILIHEMIHKNTAITTMVMDVEDNPDYYKARFSDKTYSGLVKLSQEFKAQMSEVYHKVKALNDIRQQALDQLKKEDPGLFNLVYEGAVKGNILYRTPAEKRMARMIYALASNQEFLTHIFTDADVMRWLNNRKADIEKSFWDQVVDAIASIMKAVADFIGVGVEEGSLLEEGVKRAMDIMRMQQALPTITTKGITDINPDIFKNSVLASAAINPGAAKKIGVVIARLEDQRREIRQTFTGSITKEQAARKRQLLDDLDREISELTDEQDLQVVAEVGKRQLKWVNDIMSRKNPDANDIMVADRILELWTNLITVMYGDNTNVARIDKEWSDLASEAQVKRQQLTSMAISRLITESKGQLSKRDFTAAELEDPSWIQVRIRGLSSATKSKALQYVATYMEDAGRMVNEDVLRLLKQTQQLEDDFIKYAGSKKTLPEVYKKLMQENDTGTAWGLVKRYSGAWYGFLTDAKSRREHRIDVINRDKGLSGIQKGAAKKAAWQDYWKSISSQGAFVDTRIFFDDKGDNHVNFDKAFQELVNEVGQEQATKVVEKARERYKEYIEERETFKDMMEGDVLGGVKTREEADKEIQAWIGRYSPNVFFNNFKNNFAVFNENNTDRFVVIVPKQKHAKYFDKKFTELQQDPKLYELYNRLHDTLMKLRSHLPKTLQYQLGENFLPVVARSLVSDISNVPEYIKGMPDRFIRSLTATSWEEANKGSDRIPIAYVDTSKEKSPAEIATRSKDLIKITELFGAMALHYKHFANAKDVIDMGQSIIREVDRTRMRDGKIVDEHGRVLSAPEGLKNAMDALQYMKEYIMYKRAKSMEGNTNIKIYSLNPKEQLRIAHRVKELIIQKEKLNEQLLNGDIDGQTWKDKTKEIDDELVQYDGKTIYGSKVGDKLISIQQAKALSFNPFSAVANFTFGVVSSAIFANGRQEFGNSEFRKALRIMMSSTGKWASFGLGSSEQSRKIMNVMDRLGVMGDVVESTYGKLENRQRIPNWKKTINPYNWLRSGDYFCRGLNTVATLLNKQVKVTEDGVEKEITLWEALNADGEWDSKRFGSRPEWFSEDVSQQTEWIKMRDKVARVNMIIMGNVDKVSPKMANKWIIGRLLGQFRLSWLPEGWYSRFAEEKYDIQLERYTKGRFTTYKDLGIGGSLRVLLKQYVSIATKTDPFTGEHKMDGKPISTADIENMRRNFAEINFYLMIVGAVIMLKSLRGDDDDKDESLQILLNMILRMKQDVAFYSSPEVFDTVTRNAIPAFGVIKDYGKLMDATWKIMTEDDFTADRWLLKLTKAGLPIPQATLINKIKYMSERDLDDISR